jgi:hypothetical protein
MELTSLADYFCLSTLKTACEGQLCARVTEHTCRQLEVFAEEVGLGNLGMFCASQAVRL